MDGAVSLADLVNDVLDLVAQGLVLPDLVQLKNGLLVAGLDAEKLRGGITCLLLGVQIDPRTNLSSFILIIFNVTRCKCNFPLHLERCDARKMINITATYTRLPHHIQYYVTYL